MSGRAGRRYNNGPNAGVVLALVGFFALLGLVVAGGMLLLSRSSAAQAPGGSIVWLVDDGGGRTMLRIAEPHVSERLFPNPTEPPATPRSGRILVLVGAGPSLGIAQSPEARRYALRLHRDGWTVSHPSPGSGPGEFDAEATTAAIGIAGVSTYPDETLPAERLATWLARPDVDYDGVVWVGESTTGLENGTRIVTPPGVSPGPILESIATAVDHRGVRHLLVRGMSDGPGGVDLGPDAGWSTDGLWHRRDGHGGSMRFGDVEVLVHPRRLPQPPVEGGAPAVPAVPAR